jgi:hypothetical protein
MSFIRCQWILGPIASCWRSSPEHLTLEKLERLMGKLRFATRVLSLPVHWYRWCLKATRRLFMRCSCGMIQGATSRYNYRGVLQSG